MEHDFQTLAILAEVLVAFVAFSAIVASIKLTIGGKLDAYQLLLIHFFVEGGMLATSVCLLPMVLWNFVPDERLVTQIVSGYLLVTLTAYMIWYMRRRLAADAPTPWTSAVIITGYFAWIPLLFVNAGGWLWEPRLASLEAAGFYTLVSVAVVFVTFLKTFLDVHSTEQAAG